MSKAKVEEEDLDELDDVLDQFTNPQPVQPLKSTPQSSTVPPVVPATSSSDEPDDTLSEEFAKQFADEMQTLMRQLNASSSSSAPQNSGAAAGTDAKAQAAFREAWEKMLVQDLEADGKGKGNLDTFLGTGDDPSKDTDIPQAEPQRDAKYQSTSEESDPFQKAIRQAMEKLQESDDTLKANSMGAHDSLDGLLASLGSLNIGEGDERGENLESILETVMSQLMSKEILYEPLKELDTKYPEYLAKNAAILASEDLSRYTDQRIRVSQIVALFENPSYSDDNAAQSAEVLRLMNEMQSYGSPPSEIMGAMPPGLDLGVDGLPNMPEGCVIS